MITIREAILVEGRYDKAKLSSIFDTLILESHGFSVFNDRERLDFLRRVAVERGLVVLTDPDSAGFLIRRFLRGAIRPEDLYHAYVPDTPGKEKRKKVPSKEGLLGVEGLSEASIIEAVRRSGAHFLGEAEKAPRQALSRADFYALGLSGGENAAEKRRAIARQLSLPQRLSAKELFAVLNALYDRETLLSMLSEESEI